MQKLIIVSLTFLLPFTCLSQIKISGRILNQADTKPIANASVFLSNATVGTKTSEDGTFNLQNVKPGKYDLVISIVGYETYNQSLTAAGNNIVLADITLFPKTTALNEVTIRYHSDPDKEKYLDWFKDEFLGSSEIAKQCKILNPGVIDFDYNEQTRTLTASTSTFLEIWNELLGYKIKYLLSDFKLINHDNSTKKTYYKGAVLYEQTKGTPAKVSRWERARQEVYENSAMHFFRAAYNKQLEEEGFRVLQLANYPNPDRPAENLIETKINQFKKSILEDHNKDSLAYWEKKQRLPFFFQKLLPYPLKNNVIVIPSGKPNLLAMGCDNDNLYVTYNKQHHFHKGNMLAYLDAQNNMENTLISFNEPITYFYSNGIIANPYSILYTGVWGKKRVAELLPLDYEPESNVGSNVQVTDTVNAQFAAKLNTILSGHSVEKVYLQFDKPCYTSGDTIYFKAYVTMGEKHKPSDISGVLHIDLINMGDTIAQSIKLKINEGVAWGDFSLPDSLRTGNYRIRAYTRWMQNDSTMAFFEKVIPVGSFRKTNITENSPINLSRSTTKNDIQFFPEGGNMVLGIGTKIAFKAIGANGEGINVNGIVLDDENNEVCTIAVSHLGMGYFYLNPIKGKIYRAKITYTDGSTEIKKLPPPLNSGIIIADSSNSTSGNVIHIKTEEVYLRANHDSPYTLIIYSGDSAKNITFSLNKLTIDLTIPKNWLSTGVATTTLVSPQGEPLCERLFFVQNDDQLKLNLTGKKQTYVKKEKVILKLSTINKKGNPAAGHFSASVVNESLLSSNGLAERTIMSELLLTSELNGYIEQPNYYFTDTSADVRNKLDILMLTQGYRRFKWMAILHNEHTLANNVAEKGLDISGMLKSNLGNPIVNGTVNLITSSDGKLLNTLSDNKGNFHFTDLNFSDTTNFVLNAVDKHGNKAARITFFKENAQPFVKALKIPVDQRIPDNLLSRYMNNIRHEKLTNPSQDKGTILKEVKIKEIKSAKKYSSSNLGGSGYADQVLHREDIRYGTTLANALNGKLRGVLFNGGFPSLPISAGTMAVYVDGAQIEMSPKINPSGINVINPNDVETVELLKYASASIYGMNGGHGVLVITTRQGVERNPKEITSSGILPISQMGYYTAREFYVPKYDHSVDNQLSKDLRSTIYWKPEIKTDENGNASLEFYNNDTIGTYKMVIEGIDAQGNIGRQIFEYLVN